MRKIHGNTTVISIYLLFSATAAACYFYETILVDKKSARASKDQAQTTRCKNCDKTYTGETGRAFGYNYKK